jgi:hypothetical protein
MSVRKSIGVTRYADGASKRAQKGEIYAQKLERGLISEKTGSSAQTCRSRPRDWQRSALSRHIMVCSYLLITISIWMLLQLVEFGELAAAANSLYYQVQAAQKSYGAETL